MTAYNDVLNELQYYILDEHTIERSLKMRLAPLVKEKRPMTIETTKIKNKIFIPREKDTLFWCFFILKNGETKYETMYNRNDVVAKQIKIEYVEKVRKNKQTIKTYKFDTISNIENNLANDNNLNVKTFLTLCAIENINILFVNNKTFYELRMNDSDTVFIIYSLSNKENKNYISRYGFEMGSNDASDQVKSTLFKIDKIDKPIKSVSSYKVSELIEICDRLAIETTNKETNKSKSKNDLYESIIQYF